MNKIIDSLRDKIIECGALVRQSHDKLFGLQKMQSEYKDNDTPVTRLDCEINEIMMLWAKKYKLGYVGEEGNGPTNNQKVLCVDSLDGTEAFLRGMNTSTIIATIMHMDDNHGYGKPIAGIIHQPLGDRTWVGEYCGQTFFYPPGSSRGEAIYCSSAHRQKIKTAICSFPGASLNFKEVSDRIIASRDFDDQQMGGFGIGGGLVASSLIHATAIAPTAATESVAMSLIVRGAGGVACDLLGNSFEWFEFGEVRGKLDFMLPRGALFASSHDVADRILTIIADCN